MFLYVCVLVKRQKNKQANKQTNKQTNIHTYIHTFIYRGMSVDVTVAFSLPTLDCYQLLTSLQSTVPHAQRLLHLES